MEFGGTKSDIKTVQKRISAIAQFCICCLNTECRLYSLDRFNLYEAYENLTGKSVTIHSIRRINRSTYKSNITKKIFEPDHCDYSFSMHNLEIKTELKAKNEEKYHEVAIVPKVEVLQNIKSDEEYLDDSIENEMGFINNEQTDNKQLVTKTDQFSDGEYEDVEFLCDSDWELPKDNWDSEAELVQNNVATKRKSTTQSKPLRNVKRRTDKESDALCNTSIQDDLLMFTITHLTYEEQMVDLLRRRDSDHFRGSSYKCMKCYRGFGSANTYEAHIKKHSRKFGQFQCQVCKIYLESNSKLRLHTVQYHNTRFSCNRCSFVTNHKNLAVNHGRWHRGFTFKCPHCEEEYTKKSSYFSHLRQRHPSDIVCRLCGFFFINQKGLQVHTNLRHRNEKKENLDGPLCEPCNIRFASNYAYQQHLSVSPRHIISRFLGQQKQDSIEESAHGTTGENELVECEQCGIQLEGFQLYSNHFQRYHPGKKQTKSPQCIAKPVLCEQCGTSFKDSYALRDHVFKMHTVQKKFQCDICSKKYSLRTNLIVHLRTHGGVQTTFECPICEKRFPNKANTQRHILIHKEKKPFKCIACEKTFVSASARRCHVRHTHLKEPWPKKNRGPKVRASRPRHYKDVVRGIPLPQVVDQASVSVEYAP
ncbi:zinc finger protein 37-like isoform X2 [Pararge aegeria]|uniref:zinc finger protein 37-like isoform X2 n=1 Tax=Pararge aegeria TaxID=116150 RepID=UPI0019D24D32|nr:zinc finger protein 37-like isoform X2 [Pararge aegeria]